MTDNRNGKKHNRQAVCMPNLVQAISYKPLVIADHLSPQYHIPNNSTTGWSHDTWQATKAGSYTPRCKHTYEHWFMQRARGRGYGSKAKRSWGSTSKEALGPASYQAGKLVAVGGGGGREMVWMSGSCRQSLILEKLVRSD